MAIVVQHQPDFGVVGSGAVSIGQGRRRRYEDQFAMQTAELAMRKQQSDRASAMQIMEMQNRQNQVAADQKYRYDSMKHQALMQQAGFGQQQDMQKAGFGQQQDMQQGMFEQQDAMQKAGFKQQFDMNILDEQQRMDAFFNAGPMTEMQRIQGVHAQMEAEMHKRGFEYMPEQKAELDNIASQRSKIIQDDKFDNTQKIFALNELTKKMARILPSRKREPEQTSQEQFDQEMAQSPDGTIYTRGNWKQASVPKKETQEKALSFSDIAKLRTQVIDSLSDDEGNYDETRVQSELEKTIASIMAIKGKAGAPPQQSERGMMLDGTPAAPGTAIDFGQSGQQMPQQMPGQMQEAQAPQPMQAQPQEVPPEVVQKRVLELDEQFDTLVNEVKGDIITKEDLSKFVNALEKEVQDGIIPLAVLARKRIELQKILRSLR